MDDDVTEVVVGHRSAEIVLEDDLGFRIAAQDDQAGEADVDGRVERRRSAAQGGRAVQVGVDTKGEILGERAEHAAVGPVVSPDPAGGRLGRTDRVLVRAVRTRVVFDLPLEILPDDVREVAFDRERGVAAAVVVSEFVEDEEQARFAEFAAAKVLTVEKSTAPFSRWISRNSDETSSRLSS
ncbi:hypothetical protein D8S78_00275 [Natrialba swarupiae]|nr:hypothetical protein [Natrialba swarupiae]